MKKLVSIIVPLLIFIVAVASLYHYTNKWSEVKSEQKALVAQIDKETGFVQQPSGMALSESGSRLTIRKYNEATVLLSNLKGRVLFAGIVTWISLLFTVHGFCRSRSGNGESEELEKAPA